MYKDMEVIETDTTVTVKDSFGQHTFELVNEVPYGYVVWNIGENMAPGYLPLCRLCYMQPFPGCREIETATLKAVKIDGAEHIIKAVGGGLETMEEMEQYVEKFSNSSNDFIKHWVEIYRKAIPVMKKIKWNR